MTIPSLFHLVRKDFGSKFADQSDQINSKTFKHILKWTDSEIAKIDHDREIRKVRLVGIDTINIGGCHIKVSHLVIGCTH